MDKTRKYVFVGNRRFVLKEMLEQNLQVAKALVASGTHLEKDIKKINIPYQLFHSKNELLTMLNSLDFDVLVSNGCPYILPISKMKQRTYVNIHPSMLPDLKGIDPVIGSVLFQRDSGATCHIMDDGIDTGSIIFQVRIPYSNDLDVSLLYQLSFIAERKVFREALDRNFKPLKPQISNKNLLYYSRKSQDKEITFKETNQELINKIKAFNNKSQGCTFVYQNESYKVYEIKILDNEFLKEYARDLDDYQIIFCYEDCIVFKKDGEIIKFDKVNGDLSRIKISSYINKISHAVSL